MDWRLKTLLRLAWTRQEHDVGVVLCMQIQASMLQLLAIMSPIDEGAAGSLDYIYMYLAHLALHPSERHVAWRGVDSQLVCIFTYAYKLGQLMSSVLCTKIFGGKLEEGDDETGLAQCSSQRSLIAACRMNLPVYKAHTRLTYASPSLGSLPEVVSTKRGNQE